jgi:hypothetical protein
MQARYRAAPRPDLFFSDLGAISATCWSDYAKPKLAEQDYSLIWTFWQLNDINATISDLQSAA